MGGMLILTIFLFLFGMFLIVCGEGTMLHLMMGILLIIFSVIFLIGYFTAQDAEEARDVFKGELIEEIKDILGGEAEFFDAGTDMYDYKVRVDNLIYDVDLDNEKEIEYILFNNEIIYEKSDK